jgi:hypothetical protein
LFYDPDYSSQIYIYIQNRASMTDQRPPKLALFRDLENPGGLWRVEWSDSEGAMYITIFGGPEAETRARDYHEAISEGRLASHIAGDQRAA